MNRIYLYEKQLQAIYDELSQNGTYFVDSTSSIWVPSLKIKYIDKEQCKEHPDLNGEVILRTPGEAARIELERYLGKPKMIVKRRHVQRLNLSPPRFWRGKPYDGEVFYCDLKGAYYQLYKELTLDIVWPRGLGELELRPVGERLADWKVARNSVVGVTRAVNMTVVKNGEVKLQKFRNVYFNPDLWFTIQNILHELAYRAIKEGAIYCATDCYLFTKLRHFERFSNLLDTYGMDYHSLRGDGYVYGWSSYKVDAKQTQIHRRKTPGIKYITETEGTLKWWKMVKDWNAGL